MWPFCSVIGAYRQILIIVRVLVLSGRLEGLHFIFSHYKLSKSVDEKDTTFELMMKM